MSNNDTELTRTFKYAKQNGIKIDDHLIELSKKNFHSLKKEEANLFLDTELELLGHDLLDEAQLCILFYHLDLHKRYHDMLFILAAYSRILCDFEDMISIEEYNITKKWNNTIDFDHVENIDKETCMMLSDLIPDFYGSCSSIKFANLVKNKIFKNKNREEIEEIFEKILTKIYD